MIPQRIAWWFGKRALRCLSTGALLSVWIPTVRCAWDVEGHGVGGIAFQNRKHKSLISLKLAQELGTRETQSRKSAARQDERAKQEKSGEEEDVRAGTRGFPSPQRTTLPPHWALVRASCKRLSGPLSVDEDPRGLSCAVHVHGGSLSSQLNADRKLKTATGVRRGDSTGAATPWRPQHFFSGHGDPARRRLISLDWANAWRHKLRFGTPIVSDVGTIVMWSTINLAVRPVGVRLGSRRGCCVRVSSRGLRQSRGGQELRWR